MIALKYLIASLFWGELLAGCSYFDSDGLSESTGKSSVEDVQGCYYDSGNRYSDEGRYWECISICINGDSATVSEKKVYMNNDFTEINSTKPPSYKENRYDVEISEIVGNGVLTNNVRIGKEYYRYFINENPKYLRIYKKYVAERVYMASEENVCEKY
ncbi:MAG: hypothetical protein HUK20_15685 [Fibrobacter sp.]|nr:hypothetical protein [Fibrobacter sp.]